MAPRPAAGSPDPIWQLLDPEERLDGNGRRLVEIVTALGLGRAADYVLHGEAPCSISANRAFMASADAWGSTRFPTGSQGQDSGWGRG
jgi:hypothetical protein